jgi:hypothetical protein
VGGACGTAAKTISAYDKEVSDNIYGSGSRYVSRLRFEAMRRTSGPATYAIRKDSGFAGLFFFFCGYRPGA